MESNRIRIFDTTLREGDQTMGVCFDGSEKAEIACSLAAMGVDVIEAGFPVASKADFAGVKKVAEAVKETIVSALVRSNQRDIDLAREALASAEKPRINVFMGTSDILLEHKIQMSREQVEAHAQEAVRYACQFFKDVQFSAEDAMRSDWDFLCRVFNKVIAAGATTITVCDTVGYAMPDEIRQLLDYMKAHVIGIDKVTVGIHCHNDLGQAVANSLAALKAGACQIECTVNGLGERAGNTDLAAVAMALYTRQDIYPDGSRLDISQLSRVSKLVSSLSGMPVPALQPIVGDNAFRHSNVMHQNSVANYAATYEIMRPEQLGIKRDSAVLTLESSREQFNERVLQLGYELTVNILDKLYEQFQQFAAKKKLVFDRDIEAMVNSKDNEVIQHYVLEHHNVLSGSQTLATASVRIRDHKGGLLEEASIGDGPVDAVFKAVKKATGCEAELKDYQLKAVTSGQDALGEATVWVEHDKQLCSGRGLSTDVIEASAKAYINALNKLITGNMEPKD